MKSCVLPNIKIEKLFQDEAVKNLSNLMNNIEQYKTQKIDDDLESKLDTLTDQLINAFDGKEEVKWQNGKPPAFRKQSWEELK